MAVTHTIDTLKNGVRVVHIPMSGNPAVTMMTLIGAGSEYEKEKEAGVSHFLEHILFKGSKKRPQSIDISRELDQIGAAYNAATSREYTAYYAKAARVHLNTVADILSDIVLEPLIRNEDVERERGVVLEELNMYRDLPQDRVGDLFAYNLYGEQPAGRDVIGTRETVSSFTRKELASYHRRHYTAEKMVVVIAGGVSHEKAIEAGEQYFGNVPAGKDLAKRRVRAHTPDSRVVHEYKKTDQTHIVLGGHGYHRYHEDMWTFSVLQSVLDGGMSSRIFQRIRERMGVAYYAGFDSSAHIDYGTWAMYAGVTTSRVSEVLEAMLEECADVRSTQVDEEELAKAKDHLIGTLLLSLETSTARARFYGFQVLFNEDPVHTPKEIRKKIQGVTADEVERMAQKYLAPENMHLAVVGPHRSARRWERILESAVI